VNAGESGPPAGLKQALDGLYRTYDHPASARDPVEIVRRFADPRDQEVVGFLAAGLAFGRVESILATLERVLTCLGPEPAAFVRAFDPRRDGDPLRLLQHRWTRGTDLVALVWILRTMIEQAGSLEAWFLAGDDSAAPDIRGGLESFSARARQIDVRPAYGRPPARPGVAYFFPRPSAGSACKRLNLFLRWMVRRDGIDLGAWRNLPASRLVIPLDTHVIRLGRALGLTRYRTPGWRMAADITASLRRLDPDDPVRYDFSLCHVGIEACVSCAAPAPTCPLARFCAPPAGKMRASRRPSGPR